MKDTVEEKKNWSSRPISRCPSCIPLSTAKLGRGHVIGCACGQWASRSRSLRWRYDLGCGCACLGLTSGRCVHYTSVCCWQEEKFKDWLTTAYYNALQHTTTHYNTLQQTTVHQQNRKMATEAPHCILCCTCGSGAVPALVQPLQHSGSC